MRVVMIGPFGLHPRGTMSARALPLARALGARGHRVLILLPSWQSPEDAGRSWHEGVTTVCNVDLPPRVPGLFHLALAQRLVRRALDWQPDVIHFFKPKAYSGLAHWLLVHRPGSDYRRLVVDTDDWEGAGGWNEVATYTPLARRFFAWQERWGLTHADAVTVASRALETLVWSLGVSPRRVHYVPNGAASWASAAAHLGGGTLSDYRSVPEILLYTRFFEFSVERVIDLLQRVRRVLPAVRLRVVGRGLNGEEHQLLALAEAWGLADAVHYVGFLERQDLLDAFARAWLAIYPFDDTLINRTKCAAKLMDLLSAGLPVVAEAVGQNREMICHGETGWLVPSGDQEAFAAAVVRLLTDHSLRTELGKAAARDVRTRLGWSRLARTVEQAYGLDGL